MMRRTAFAGVRIVIAGISAECVCRSRGSPRPPESGGGSKAVGFNTRSGYDVSCPSEDTVVIQQNGQTIFEVNLTGGGMTIQTPGDLVIQAGGNIRMTSGGATVITAGSAMAVTVGSNFTANFGGTAGFRSMATMTLQGSRIGMTSMGDITTSAGSSANFLVGSNLTFTAAHDIGIKAGHDLTLKGSKILEN
ncbi:MAG: hypothetical protein ABI833_17525 [Acidobacteriota bacterium]